MTLLALVGFIVIIAVVCSLFEIDAQFKKLLYYLCAALTIIVIAAFFFPGLFGGHIAVS